MKKNITPATVYVAQAEYSTGTNELFGPFPTHEQARAWAEGLKRRPGSMVVDYKIRPINPP